MSGSTLIIQSTEKYIFLLVSLNFTSKDERRNLQIKRQRYFSFSHFIQMLLFILAIWINEGLIVYLATNCNR